MCLPIDLFHVGSSYECYLIHVSCVNLHAIECILSFYFFYIDQQAEFINNVVAGALASQVKV